MKLKCIKKLNKLLGESIDISMIMVVFFYLMRDMFKIIILCQIGLNLIWKNTKLIIKYKMT